MKKTAAPFITILLVSFITPKAFAKNLENPSLTNQLQNSEKVTQNLQEKTQNQGLENAIQNREEIMQKACEKTQEKIRKRVSQFAENKKGNVEKYQKAKNKVADTAKKLRARGFDTEILEADIEEMDVLIKQYANQYQLFIDTLEESEENTCGGSQGEYANKLRLAQGYLKQARETRRSIWDFYRNTLRKDMFELRKQIEQEESAVNE